LVCFLVYIQSIVTVYERLQLLRSPEPFHPRSHSAALCRLSTSIDDREAELFLYFRTIFGVFNSSLSTPFVRHFSSAFGLLKSLLSLSPILPVIYPFIARPSCFTSSTPSGCWWPPCVPGDLLTSYDFLLFFR